MKSKSSIELRNTKYNNGLITFINKDVISENTIPIENILKSNPGVVPSVFDVSTKIFNTINLSFDDEYDQHLLLVNHYTLHEFIYNIVKLTLDEHQQTKN